MTTESIETFRNFIAHYRTVQNKCLLEVIEKMSSEGRQRVILNVNDMRAFDKPLVTDMMNDPVNLIPLIEEELSNICRGRVFFGVRGSFGEYALSPRTLSSVYIGRMVCAEGIVTSCSICRPKIMKSVHYNSNKNVFYEKEYRDPTMITKLPITNTVYPTRDVDGTLLTTELGLSEYFDYQTAVLQEIPETAPPGQLPRSADVVLSFDLVDSVKPGDRIRVYGIYKSLHAGTQQFPQRFKTVLVANNVERIGVKYCDKEELWSGGEFVRLAEMKDIHLSVAPSIFGHDSIKKAIALFLVGGNEVVMKNGSKIRGNINVLLIGDPSTAKSQMLRYALNAVPLSVATTGKGCSGVGLTAAVVVDKDNGDRRLEAGAMVLADGGIVCIDEFDKMSDGDRVAIHEVMEQQTVTIAKAGIHTTLNARCSVLAAANPVWGQYVESKPPQDNVRLPESLLTRFDLIFIVLDKFTAEEDQLISNHVLKMHTLEHGYVEEGLGVDQKLFRAYIQYCKGRHPTLSKEAASAISKEYVFLRQIKSGKEQVVSVTPRTLETVIRLATANAKLRLSDVVERDDVECAVCLVKDSLFQKVVKPAKKAKIGNAEGCGFFDDASEERDALKQHFENVRIDRDKIEFITNTLYDYSADNRNPRAVDISDLIAHIGTEICVTENEVVEVLKDLSGKDLILFENGRIYFIN